MDKILVLIYCRVSSLRQKLEGHGLESQEHRCRKFAEENRYEVAKVFLDSFTGGGDFMKRPAMVELLKYIDVHPHQQFLVVFDDLSRLARDVSTHIALRVAFGNRGVQLKCLNFNFEDSDESELVEMVMAAQNQYHRKQNRRQVIQKQKARLEKGYWPFYPPPGYKQEKSSLHGKLLVPKDPEASIIREALEKYASGELCEQMDVLRFLISKDYYKNRKGKRPYVEDVKRLLTRPIYAGYVEYSPWEVSRIRGHHKPLVSAEVFEKIQDRFLGKVRIQTRKDINADFPLRGFILCTSCQKPYTASWSRGRNAKFGYYRCATSNCPMKNRGIPKSVIESDFETLLRQIKPKPAILSLTKAVTLDVWKDEMKKIRETEKQHKARLEEIQEEIKGFMDRVSKTKKETLIQEYEQQIENLIREKEQIETKTTNAQQKLSVSFETALNQVFEVLENPHIQWEKEDLFEKRMIFKIVFEKKLAYDPQNGFGTAELSLPLRVFEQVVGPNLQGVEMAGVEPASNEFFTDTLHA